MMLRGRPTEPPPLEVMIVVDDGGNNAGCSPILAGANQVKSQAVLLKTVCVGSACDRACLRQAATSPRHFYDAGTSAALIDIFGDIYDELKGTSQLTFVKTLRIADQLPPNMRYLPGSALPPAAFAGKAAVAAVAVDGERKAFGRAFDADHGGIGARPNDRVCAHELIVLAVNPFLGRQIRRAQKLL